MKTTSSTYRMRGLTLPEMLVAVMITIGMLLMVSSVFKSATEASGSALALNDISGQARVLTRQLQQDLAGFQKGLPWAIVFEAHANNTSDPTFNPGDETTWRGVVDEPDRWVRYDRICFFAGGDFQGDATPFWPALSGSLARIFYGQMFFGPGLPVASDVAPPRSILSRREKIILADGGLPDPYLGGLTWTAEYYDWYPYERASTAFWAAEPWQRYVDFYFNQTAVVSFVRPPHYQGIQAAIDDNLVTSGALQQLYLLPDVTDFRIQLYIFDRFIGANGEWRWFPDDQDFQAVAVSVGVPTIIPFAFYYNVEQFNGLDLNGDDYETGIGTGDPTWIKDWTGGNIPWFSREDVFVTSRFGTRERPTNWPRAIRFSFTLYDQNRRRFDKGQTYDYVMEIPERY